MDKSLLFADISKMIWQSSQTMLMVIAIGATAIKGPKIFYIAQFISFFCFIISMVSSGRGMSENKTEYYQRQTIQNYFGLIIFGLSFLTLL